MEQNTHLKKKRTSHMDMENHVSVRQCEEGFADSFDVLSIMEQMDTYSSVNMSMCSELFKNKNSDKLNVSRTNKGQTLTTASSSSNSQAEKNALSKFKKLSTTRKFPLMEKTQKTLKQLKHNRSIPKPRAHVASTIPILPTKADTGFKPSNSSQNKKQSKVKEKLVRNKDTPVTILPTKSCTESGASKFSQKKVVGKKDFSVTYSHLEVKTFDKSKNAVLNYVEQSSAKVLKANKKGHVKCDNVETKRVDIKINHSDSTDSSKDNHSNDETTDTEYERFIQSNKMEHEEDYDSDDYEGVSSKQRKKAVKKKKTPRRKSTCQRRSTLESLPEQYDPNFCDDLSNDSNQKVSIETKRSDIKINHSDSTDSSKDNHSNDETTDSEFEVFIQNNKMEHEEDSDDYEGVSSKQRKKAVKKKKTPRRKSIRQRRSTLESHSEQYDPNFCDDSSNDCNQKVSIQTTAIESNATINNTPDSYSFQHLNDANEDSRISLKSDDGFEAAFQRRKSKRLMKGSASKSITEQDGLSNNYQRVSTKATEIESNATVNNTPDTYSFQQFNDANEDSRISLQSNDGFEATFQRRKSKRLMKSSALESNPEQYDSSNDCYQNICMKTTEVELDATINNTETSSFQHFNEDSRIGLSSQMSIMKDEPSAECLRTLVKNSSQDIPTKSSDRNLLEVQNADVKLASFSLYNASGSNGLVHSVNSEKIYKQASSKDAETIDLCSSDSEAESAGPAQHFGSCTQNKEIDELERSQNLVPVSANSTELDIEIIEVASIPNKIEETNLGSHNKSYIAHSLTSAITTVKNIAEKVIKPIALDSVGKGTPQAVETYSNVKKEIVEKTLKKEVENAGKEVYKEAIKKEVVESNNPVYSTNICKKYIEDEVTVPVNGRDLKNYAGSTKSSDNQYQNNKSDDDIMIIESDVKCHSQPIPNKIVKNEMEEDADIIVDFVSIKNPLAKNAFNCKRKIESCLDSNIQSSVSCSKIPKILETQSMLRERRSAFCEGPPSTNSLIKETLFGESTSDTAIEMLLEIYKKELKTYTELLATEVNLEASLKFIEKQQMEKLQFVRSLIQDEVKNIPNCADFLVGNNSSKFCENPSGKIQSPLQGQVSFHMCQETNSVNLLSQTFSDVPLVVKAEKDEKTDTSRVNLLPASLITESSVKCKSEPPGNEETEISRLCLLPGSLTTESSVKCKSEPPEDTQRLSMFGKKCDACGKEAVAACQRCAKVFFCSNECGKQFWNNGHENVCGK